MSSFVVTIPRWFVGYVLDHLVHIRLVVGCTKKWSRIGSRYRKLAVLCILRIGALELALFAQLLLHIL